MERGLVSPVDPFGATFERVIANFANGARFAGLFGSAKDDAIRLIVVMSKNGVLQLEQAIVPSGSSYYTSMASDVPAALWYEREIFDLFGLASDAGSALESLILPLAKESQRPRPGAVGFTPTTRLDLTPLPTRLRGEGVFTMSYGPVRSGVFESIEYLVETPGEEIPSLSTRVFYKHRGVEKRFEGMSVRDGVLLAERCEGVASVAHAIAFSGAIEQIGDLAVSLQAGCVRVLHAELERIVNHLDSLIRHVEAAGQAVAYARFSFHKEKVQRLRARLCGSRFGRGVVVPGGVSGPPALRAHELHRELDSLQGAIEADTKLLMNTPSFVDRLRGTGVLSAQTAREFSALGPVARGSGIVEDVRQSRPYAAYGHLGHGLLEIEDDGDALARQRVRAQEILGSFELIRRAVEVLDELGEPSEGRWALRLPELNGEAIGWAEAPQGEVLTWVEVRDGKLVRVKPRSASFHNLSMFSRAFPKDILTDFAFIEASFGISIAGVAN